MSIFIILIGVNVVFTLATCFHTSFIHPIPCKNINKNQIRSIKLYN